MVDDVGMSFPNDLRMGAALADSKGETNGEALRSGIGRLLPLAFSGGLIASIHRVYPMRLAASAGPLIRARVTSRRRMYIGGWRAVLPGVIAIRGERRGY
jgi:hypothetical protein